MEASDTASITRTVVPIIRTVVPIIRTVVPIPCDPVRYLCGYSDYPYQSAHKQCASGVRRASTIGPSAVEHPPLPLRLWRARRRQGPNVCVFGFGPRTTARRTARTRPRGPAPPERGRSIDRSGGEQSCADVEAHGSERAPAPTSHRTVPGQMWAGGARSGCRCGKTEPRSRRRCGQDERSPGADVGGVSPGPAAAHDEPVPPPQTGERPTGSGTGQDKPKSRVDGRRSQMLPPKLRPNTRNAHVRVRVCAYIEMDVYVCTYIYISEAVAASAAHSMRRLARYH
jgi:hypothetical protein